MKLTALLITLVVFVFELHAQTKPNPSRTEDRAWGTNAEQTELTGAKDRVRVVIFPNPASEHIDIHTQSEIKEVVLLKVIGEYRKSFDKKTSIDISHLKPGIYLVKVRMVNGKKVVKKLIIQ